VLRVFIESMLNAIALVESGTKAVLEGKRQLLTANNTVGLPLLRISGEPTVQEEGKSPIQAQNQDNRDTQWRLETNFRRLLNKRYQAAVQHKERNTEPNDLPAKVYISH
jgi:hypothetical protein